MRTDNLRIKIDNFRVIRNADIALNGITVLSGVNGSGKSTVAKLTYSIIKSLNEYESLLVYEFNDRFDRYRDVLLNIYRTSLVLTASDTSDLVSEWRDTSKVLDVRNVQGISNINGRVAGVCDYIIEKANVNNNLGVDRFRTMLLRTLEQKEGSLSFEDALKRIQNIIKDLVSQTEKKFLQRPVNLVRNYLEVQFAAKIEQSVSVFEYGETLFGKTIESVPFPHFVEKSFYIDTPFIIDDDRSSYINRKDIHNAIKYPAGKGENRFFKTISSSIIHGEARYDRVDTVQSGLIFRDSNGNEFDLKQCATGIKSFALLQLLLKNGHIREDTLLILDEPEAHLHPQWIVEYARLIVLMHKAIGVKFLVSSHSTDLVRALRYIAEAEDCLNNLEFYCTTKAQDRTGRFNIKSTGHDIEPIFKVFNKSFNKLDSYSLREGDEEAE